MEYKQAETHRTKHEGDDDEDHDNNDGNMTSLDTVYFRDNADLVNKDDVRKRTAWMEQVRTWSTSVERDKEPTGAL